MNNFTKILKLKLDDNLTAIILDRVSLFKYINPNFLTISGLILNFIILKLMIEGVFLFDINAIAHKVFAGLP